MTTPLGEEWAAFHWLVGMLQLIPSPWTSNLIIRGKVGVIVGHPYMATALRQTPANDNEKRE